jgi:hypothetical protein
VVTVSEDGTARVWDAQTGRPLTERKYGVDVHSAQLSPDGKRVVTASWDGTACVWDAQTGKPLTEPLKHGGRVTSAEFSPDGKRVVTASADSTARVWDAQTGQPLTEPLKHSEGVDLAQFSPDGKRVVTVSSKYGTARVWDLAPIQPGYPDWLAQLAEALSGKAVGQQGVAEEIKVDRMAVLQQVREKLNREPEDDPWVIWGRWLLADQSTRTISPFAKITVPQYIDERIREGTSDSLAEAEMLAKGDGALLRKIAEARVHLQ